MPAIAIAACASIPPVRPCKPGPPWCAAALNTAKANPPPILHQVRTAGANSAAIAARSCFFAAKPSRPRSISPSPASTTPTALCPNIIFGPAAKSAGCTSTTICRNMRKTSHNPSSDGLPTQCLQRPYLGTPKHRKNQTGRGFCKTKYLSRPHRRVLDAKQRFACLTHF